MCGPPELLPAFGARTFLVLYTTIMDYKVQLLKLLNIRALNQVAEPYCRTHLLASSYTGYKWLSQADR
jgi:hypothetical protein